MGLGDLSTSEIPIIQNRHQGSSSLMGQSSKNLVKFDEIPSTNTADRVHNIGGVVISAVKNKIIINDDLSSHHHQQQLNAETSSIKKNQELSSFTVNKLNLDSPNGDLKIPF